MSLRLKLVLALVSLTAAATVAIGVLSYVGISNRLGDEIDRSLDDAAGDVIGPAGEGRRVAPDNDGDDLERHETGERPPSFEQILVQYLDLAGGVVTGPSNLDIPVTEADRLVATGDLTEARRDVSIDGTSYRVLTAPLGGEDGAVQVARSLSETDRLLASLRVLIIVITSIVVVAAAVVGWLIARQVTRRLRALTSAAEHVAETGALDIDVPVDGTDEAGRLGGAFTRMLDALARSRDAQQRLVQDAGHELRTPLTSLRTNITVLRRHDDLSLETRGRVLDQLDEEAHELTDMVNELVELATDRHDEEGVEPIDLGLVAERVVDRARRRTAADLRITTDDAVVTARPTMIERAITNLVDNAVKFAPGGPIEVTVRHGRIEVADRGPGIAPADLPHVFDRFYRSADARNRPGSGLGLAIVRDAAERHGGKAFAHPREGGGAAIGFELPVS